MLPLDYRGNLYHIPVIKRKIQDIDKCIISENIPTNLYRIHVHFFALQYISIIPADVFLCFFFILGIVEDSPNFLNWTFAILLEIQHISAFSFLHGGNTNSMLPVDLHFSLNSPFTCLISFWPFFFSIDFWR